MKKYSYTSAYRFDGSRFVNCVNDGRIDNESLKFVFPINPNTGLPTSDLSLITSPDTPEEVRASLLQGLQKLPSSVDVDEETQTILLRPRSCQSLGEVAEFAAAIESYISSQSQPSEPTVPQSHPSEPTVPQSQPSEPTAS